MHPRNRREKLRINFLGHRGDECGLRRAILVQGDGFGYRNFEELLYL